MKLEIEKSSILDFTKVQVIQEGVSLQKLPNCGAPLCTGGSVRHSFRSFLSETPFLKNVYFSIEIGKIDQFPICTILREGFTRENAVGS